MKQACAMEQFFTAHIQKHITHIHHVLDAEYSITIHSLPKTITYQLAVSNCEADGKKLCSSKTLCKDGKTPFPGDHWVPVADNYNEWMQIGK